jgi:hypothetical protein
MGVKLGLSYEEHKLISESKVLGKILGLERGSKRRIEKSA